MKAIKTDLSSLEILLSISRELAASLDLHTVLERVLSLSTTNIGAERASLIVLDEANLPNDAAMISAGNLVPTTITQMQEIITSGLAGWVIRNKKLALLNDVEKDERWLERSDKHGGYNSGKSALCIPIVAHDILVGVLTIVHSQVNFFTDEDVALQKAITDMAGIAIYNAKLYNDIQTAHVRYYDLFEKSIDPIFITDLHGKILEANQRASQVTGLANQKLLGQTIAEIHQINQEKTGENYASISAGNSLAYESTLKKLGDEPLPVEVHVSQITIEKATYLQWFFRDISEQKKVDHLRDDLSAMLYHDLRSPLANIISSLDIMANLMPLTESESLKSVFDVSRRSSERMQRMIDGLLDINRLESGQQITKKQFGDLNELVAEAIDILQSSARNKEITISTQIAGSLPGIMIDTDMIRRVIVNLLENAVKFSPNQSTIVVGAEPVGENLQIWVQDQGSGIPESAKEEIFEKFIRLKQNYPAKGLGLGLAFCKLAVQAHGGTIWIENLPQGGSQFVFTLPLVHHE
jgi:PAS domain S-box-containing protein